MSTINQNEYEELMLEKMDNIKKVIYSLFEKFQTVNFELLKDSLKKELANSLNKTEDDIERLFINNPMFKEDLEYIFGANYIRTVVMPKEIEKDIINEYNDLIRTKFDIINNFFKNNINIFMSGDVIKFINLLSIALNMSNENIKRIFFSNINYINNDIQNRFINPIKSKSNIFIFLIIGTIILVLLYRLLRK